MESIKLDSPAPCGAFAAISQLQDETAGHCPDQDQPEQSRYDSFHLPLPARSTAFGDPAAVVKPTSEQVKNNWRAKYACTRAHPLVCRNQGLVTALDVLGHSRELEGLSVNALAYERAVAVGTLTKLSTEPLAQSVHRS